MTSSSNCDEAAGRFVSKAEAVLKSHPCRNGAVGISRAPAVVDVMGGIGEDSGALVLTATAALCFHAAAWRTDDDRISVRFIDEVDDAAARDFSLPTACLRPEAEAADEIIARCRDGGCEEIAPGLLTLHQASLAGMLPPIEGGLCLVVQHDFPDHADLGRQTAHAAAVICAVFKSFALQPDRLAQSRVCAEAIARLTGLYQRRKAMTSLCGQAEGVLLQLRFHSHPLCETLDLPDGVIVKALATRLARPTTRQRLIETRTCSEMGHRMILYLQEEDGQRADPKESRLSAVTPAEFVTRYRDRMPSKITRKDFMAQFGAVRGLEDGDINPRGIYKVRSRAEHHIYENQRVHEFVASIIRARRNNDAKALENVGDLMYASHWSHSQRCGIGGVETDRLLNAIRKHGQAAGLLGAKVTSGGEGGEMVVLLRDDEQAHRTLDDLISQAKAESRQPVWLHDGALPGAEFFQAPSLAGGVVDSAGAL